MEISTNITNLIAFFNANKPTAKLGFIELIESFEVWVEYRGVAIRCQVVKDSEQLAQFNTIKSFGNIAEATPVRITTCRIGRALHDRFISFSTANNNSFDNTDWQGADWGDISYYMHDANGNLTTDGSLAVKTFISFYPNWDYEIAGGHLDIPTLQGDLGKWEAHFIGAPDIPSAFGGSVQFVCNPQLKWWQNSRLPIEAELNPKDVTGEISPLARKILLVIKHPEGVSCEFQLRVKLYR